MTHTSIKNLGAMVCVLWLGLAGASATLYSSTDSASVITDGNPAGITSSINVGGAGNILGSGDNVSVTLNLSGGNIGDLYAYLQFNNTKVVLMNQPGGGTYLNTTFSGVVTLAGGTGLDNINTYGGGAVGGTGVSYNPSAGSTALQAFNGMSANGAWTLFFADLSGNDGANVTTLNGWSLNLDMTPVPEPTNVALGIFAALGAGVCIVRKRWPVRSGEMSAK